MYKIYKHDTGCQKTSIQIQKCIIKKNIPTAKVNTTIFKVTHKIFFLLLYNEVPYEVFSQDQKYINIIFSSRKHFTNIV